MTRVEKFFSAADLAEIEKAVREAEARTAGELVPFAVSHSDHYEAAMWKGATLGAFLAVLLAALVHRLAEIWAGPTVAWIAVPSLAGGALGYLAAATVRPLKLWLAGRAAVEHHVHQRAAAAFLETEAFKTRDRTGVLIFLSLLERRVVVLGDTGINARVRQDEWDAIVAGIVKGFRDRHEGAALAAGIRGCGELLMRRKVEVRSDDADELPDNLQMREE